MKNAPVRPRIVTLLHGQTPDKIPPIHLGEDIALNQLDGLIDTLVGIVQHTRIDPLGQKLLLDVGVGHSQTQYVGPDGGGGHRPCVGIVLPPDSFAARFRWVMK